MHTIFLGVWRLGERESERDSNAIAPCWHTKLCEFGWESTALRELLAGFPTPCGGTFSKWTGPAPQEGGSEGGSGNRTPNRFGKRFGNRFRNRFGNRFRTDFKPPNRFGNRFRTDFEPISNRFGNRFGNRFRTDFQTDFGYTEGVSGKRGSGKGSVGERLCSHGDRWLTCQGRVSCQRLVSDKLHPPPPQSKNRHSVRDSSRHGKDPPKALSLLAWSWGSTCRGQGRRVFGVIGKFSWERHTGGKVVFFGVSKLRFLTKGGSVRGFPL